MERLPGVFEAGADVAAVVKDIVSNAKPESLGRGNGCDGESA